LIDDQHGDPFEDRLRPAGGSGECDAPARSLDKSHEVGI
jgi:hypothetical protein